MNKLLKLTLAVLMAVSLGACGSKDNPVDEGSDTNDNNVVTNPVDEGSNSKGESNNAAEKNSVTIRVPMEDIYVDYESKLRSFSESCGDLLLESNDALVGVCYDRYYDELPELEDVPMYFAKDFLFNAREFSHWGLFDSEYQIVTEEMVTVAGFDSVKFNAVVKNCDKWDCHVYGYAFVIDEVPLAIIGLVSAESQDADLIAEIDARVDWMASTIRTTEER